MKERLLKFLKSEGLSPALLADKLGVQRSGISHITSGRNKPSFDFIQKMLVKFPKLNADWLILGQGAMYKTTATDVADLFNSSVPVANTKPPPTVAVPPKNLSPAEGNKKQLPDVAPEISPSKEAKKSVEKMMVLYTDKTFEVYFPN